MGISKYVIGIRPPDEKFIRMAAVWNACKDAGIDLPSEVEDFFEGESPDPLGVRINLTPGMSYGGNGVREYDSDHESGYEVSLADLPKDVTIIRFIESW